MDKQEILKQANDNLDEIISWRRTLHSNPELGMELDETKQFVYDKLKEFGLEPEWVGKGGVTAMVGKKTDGKVMMLRADMDALPIEEETGLDFASKNKGKMHACGHDTHTAMLLGAAKILKENEDKINGRIKLIFQAGEETMEGAKDAVDSGILENPKVDAAMMIHIAAGMEIPHGTLLAFTNGASYSSVDWFRIDIQGKGGHGSTPNETVDPNSIMVAIHVAMQQYLSMGTVPTEDKVATICEMHGGTTNNIIPDNAYMTGTIRTFNDDVRKGIKDYMVKVSKAIAEGMGGSAEVSFSNSAPSVVSDPKVGKMVVKGLQDLLGEDKVVDVDDFAGGKFKRIMGSEDFAYYSEKVPSVVFALAAGAPSKGYKYAAHNPKTNFDENAFAIGAAAYAYTGMYWLDNQK